MDKRSSRKVAAIKKRARSELADEKAWQEFEYYKNFTPSIEDIKARDTLERIHIDQYSEKEFIEKYESQYKPCVITGAQDNWRATKSWEPKELDKKFRNQFFKCGADDDGKPVRIKMKYFVEYCKHQQDDSPLYMFDSKFATHPKKKKLLLDYNVPKYFRDDLMQYAGDAKRPPYRWFVHGPARSGTGIHIDPLGTSAWNALVHGHKWWILIPNGCPKELLVITEKEGGCHKREGITWYNKMYPRTQQPDWPQEYKPIEVLQRPGETMFVPGGWWHVVVNIDDTVAVTQNFCSVTNFPVVWHKVKQKRPMLAKRWLRELRHHRWEVAKLASGVDTSLPPPILSDTSSGSESAPSSAVSTDFEEDSDPDSPYISECEELSRATGALHAMLDKHLTTYGGGNGGLSSLLMSGMRRRQDKDPGPGSDDENPSTRTSDPIKYQR